MKCKPLKLISGMNPFELITNKIKNYKNEKKGIYQKGKWRNCSFFSSAIWYWFSNV
jgi:hypothetical protein